MPLLVNQKWFCLSFRVRILCQHQKTDGNGRLRAPKEKNVWCLRMIAIRWELHNCGSHQYRAWMHKWLLEVKNPLLTSRMKHLLGTTTENTRGDWLIFFWVVSGREHLKIFNIWKSMIDTFLERTLQRCAGEKSEPALSSGEPRGPHSRMLC